MNVNDRLKETREKKHISLSTLSELTGIAKSTLQRYETGTTKKIPMEAIPIIERALGVPSGYLMGWDSTSSVPTSDDDLLDLLRNNKEHATIIGFGDGRHIKTDMTYEDFEELEAMWRALKEKRKQDK